MNMFRRCQSGLPTGDAIPLFHDGTYHIFFLTSPKGTTLWPDRIRTTWQHAISKDLIHWEELPPALEPGKDCAIDKDGCWTGSAIYANGKFHIFYTAADLDSPNQQKIAHAVSEDGIHFKKDGDKPIIVPIPEYYELIDWRDPYVFYNEDDQKYWILIAGRRNNGPDTRRGCVVLFKSEDLANWEHYGILYDPGYTNVTECPEMFKFKNKWYLVHSRFSEFAQTIYRVSDSPYGPFRSVKYDGIGGRRFYAAKSVANDEGRRFFFGWVHDKDQNLDTNHWLWGGDFCIPHEIIQAEDGELMIKMPKEYENIFSDKLNWSFTEKWGKVSQYEETVTINSISTFSYGFFNVPSDTFYFNCKLNIQDCGDSAGIIMKACDDVSKCFMLSFDRPVQRVCLTKYPVPMDPYWADASVAVKDFSNSEVDGPHVCEKSFPFNNGDTIDLKIVIENHILEIFVDEKIAFTFRCCTPMDHDIGLYAQDAIVSFTNISFFK